MENNMTTKQKIGEFFKVNKSKIIKGTILVTAVAAGVLATKYMQLKSAEESILRLTSVIPEETGELVEVVEDVVQSN